MILRDAVKMVVQLLSAAALSALMQVSAWAETVRYADSDPPVCLRCQFLLDSYFPALAEATGGRVEINGLFGGVLGSNKENLRLASDGIVEFSSTFVGYHNNVFPAQSAFDLFPRGPREFENQLWFYRESYARIPEIQEELERSNLQLVMITPLLHLAFASKQPINSVSDIEGQKWRAGTKWLLRYLKNVGAKPVSVPWGDVFVSLETGVIDGVLTNYDGLNHAKFYEPAPHMLISPELWMANPIIYFVNRDFWDGLAQDDRDAWLATSRDAELAWGKRLYAAQEGIIESQRSKGVIVNEISDADLALWENSERLEDARSVWIEEASAAGLENAAEVLDELKKIHAEAMARDLM